MSPMSVVPNIIYLLLHPATVSQCVQQWRTKRFPFYGVMLTYADSALFEFFAKFKNVQDLNKSK